MPSLKEVWEDYYTTVLQKGHKASPGLELLLQLTFYGGAIAVIGLLKHGGPSTLKELAEDIKTYRATIQNRKEQLDNELN